jgi:Zn-dependent peptidase ImmA (M78 family)
MYPLTMKGLKIKIFRDREELNNEYYKIFMQRADLKSFYIHKYRTIYTCETDISDSVIAHELGHAVCDHYFLVIPPEKVREMLASYVDAHLEE